MEVALAKDQASIPQTKLSESPACPICDGRSELLFHKKRYPIRECLNCCHRFAGIEAAEDHVEQVYSDSYFKGAGDGNPDYLSDGKLLVRQGRRYASILNRYVELGSVLDVGTAAGFILKGFEEMGWSCTGLEPNSSMAEFARRHLGVTVETGTLEENSLRNQYDLVVMIQVAAHFIDPRRIFEAASKPAKPGGYWLIETWNRENRTARILGDRWHEYNPPSVLHWFSNDSLKEFVQEFGLREIERGRHTKWISPSHTKSITQDHRLLGVSKRLIRGGPRLIPDSMALPYLLDDIFWILNQNPDQGQVRLSQQCYLSRYV